MKSTISDVQKKIKVGTHGEDYGSWMSNPVFYVFGGIALVTLVLTALSFTVFRIMVLGVVFAAATVILVALLCWMAWIRRQYAFGKGGMMEKVHQTILSSLDFDGHGSLLEVGCGSGALAVRAHGRRRRSPALIIGVRCTTTARHCARRMWRPRVSVSNAALSTAMPTSWIFRTGALML